MALNRLMFKYKYNEEFLLDPVVRTRQATGTLYKVDKPNSSHYSKSVSYMGRKLWNDLPPYLRAMDDYDGFKVLLKGHYRSKSLGNNCSDVY